MRSRGGDASIGPTLQNWLKERVEGSRTAKIGEFGRVRLGFFKIRKPDFEFKQTSPSTLKKCVNPHACPTYEKPAHARPEREFLA